MPEHDSDERWRLNPQETTAGDNSTTADNSQQTAPLLDPSPIGLTDTDTSTMSAWEQERQALQQQLVEAQTALQAYAARSPQAESIERIGQLEQALQKSQATNERLKSQLNKQQLLETQLAATEEMATLQQQAIANLQKHLFDQQQVLEAQIIQAQAKDQMAQQWFTSVETLVQKQYRELEHLRTQLAQKRQGAYSSQKQLEQQLIQRQRDLEAQYKRVVALEAQLLTARSLAWGLEIQLTEQQRHIEALYQARSDRAYFLNQIQTQLEQAHKALEAQQNLAAILNQTQTLNRQQNQTINDLYGEIETLHAQMAQQGMMQARLQQGCLELTAERDQYQARTIELDNQIAALQEHILSKDRRVIEYETAVGNWKEQCARSLSYLQMFKQIIERLLPNPPDELLELLNAIPSPEQPESERSESSELLSTNATETLPSDMAEAKFNPKSLAIDLPGFLRKGQLPPLNPDPNAK